MSLSSHVQIVTLPDHTDADPNHLPDKAGYVRVDPPNIYLQKCAELWMKKQWPGKWQSGVMYYLKQLPRGYALYERPRPGNSQIRDQFLYGHPTHKVFYSPNEFYAHLEYIMLNNGVSVGCPCKRCASGTPRQPVVQTTARATPMVVIESPSRATPSSTLASSKPASISSSIPSSRPAPVKRGPGRPAKRFDTESLTGPLLPNATHADLTEDERATSAAAKTAVDEEDTPDTMRRLLDKLGRQGTVDEEIKEPLSMDWLAVNASIHSWLDKLSDQAAWIPRAGEVVLFVRQLPPRAEISYDSRSKTFGIWQDGKWLKKKPMWEAGVVAQESSAPLKTEDITRETQQQTSVTYSGFRIEPLPAPNQNDKRLTMRYTYNPMHQIRPFSLWGDMIPPDTAVHETITNAMLITSTVAVVGKYRIQGVWPRAEILCKGVYIGAEFLMLNDVVRLSTPSGFMQIRAIKLILTDLDTDAPWTRIFIEGCAFTTDRRRSVGQSVDIQVLPTLLQNFDEVYPLQPPKTRKRVTLNDVMGRLIEPHALGLWLPQYELGFEELLVLTSTTIRSVVKAREYSSRNDERIPKGIRWFWAETRLEALDVTLLNGVAASKYDNMRDDRLEAE